MTTVAWDGQILASDSQEELLGWASYGARKIHLVRPGIYVGLSGSDTLGNHYLRTLSSWWNDDVEKIPAYKLDGTHLDDSCNIQALMIDVRTGTPFCYRLFMSGLQPVSGPQAIGSGAAMAYPALLLGRTALGAVEFAIKHDPYSGGEIQYVDVMSGTSHYVPHPHGKKSNE